MSPSSITPTTGDIFRTAPTHRVYTRGRWQADVGWQLVAHLFANRVFGGSGPRISFAELEWRYGIGMQPGETMGATYTKQSLLDQYVKVEIGQAAGEDPLTWYGIITESGDARAGALLQQSEGTPARVLTGDQILTAYGLELLLERSIVGTSHIADSSGGADYEIQRALVFNQENNEGNCGNRSAEKGPRNAYRFTGDLRTDVAHYWSTRDIIEYLFEYIPPADADGQKWIQWKLSDRAKTCLPDWDQPVVDCQGRSLRSILNQLCDRRRMLDWQLIIASNGDVEVDVFSFNAEPLILPSGDIQQPNLDQTTLDFDRCVDAKATLKDSAEHSVDQVVVRGARKRACFTISKADGTLAADWHSNDKADYETGPAGIGALPTFERQDRVDEFRRSDQFERVFSYYRLPATWDGLVGDGVGGPKDHFYPDAGEPETVYIPGLRFQRTLPKGLLTRAPANSPEDSQPILAMLKVWTDGGTDRWQHLDQLGATQQTLAAETTGRSTIDWSASLRVQEHAPGVAIKISGPQHAMASADFTPLANIDITPDYDWQTDLLLTVTIETDSYVEEVYPSQNDVLAIPADTLRRVIVNLGDRARLDYVAPFTVVGHTDGELEYSGTGFTFVRDDRDYMEDLARFVYEWYGVKRQAFTFHVGQITGLLSVGQLITQIGAAETLETVNSVVTGLEINLTNGTTEITTSFAELDFTRL